MAQEIERKFLPRSEAWRERAHDRQRMRQGYIATGDGVSVRVRVADETAWLNIKVGAFAAARQEFEYEIPLADAGELLAGSAGGVVEKTRYLVREGGFEWEVDEFHGANLGLVVAELELESEGQDFPRPDWVGTEVTHLRRYYNVCLIDHPYSTWTDAERRP